MELLSIFCAIVFAMIAFGLLGLLALFFRCDLAAEEEKKRNQKKL